jgi:hypothetical protein
VDPSAKRRGGLAQWEMRITPGGNSLISVIEWLLDSVVVKVIAPPILAVCMPKLLARGIGGTSRRTDCIVRRLCVTIADRAC